MWKGMIAVTVLALLASSGYADVTVERDGKVANVKFDGEKPVEPAPAKKEEAEAEKPLDLAHLKELLGEFQEALYATEQEKAAAKLAKLAKPHVAELVKLIGPAEKPDLEMVRLVGFARAPEASAALLTLLDHKDHAVRSAAAFALGVCGDPKAVPKLTVRLSDPEGKVAVQSAMALGRIGEKGSYDVLVARLASKEPLQRLAAIKALGLLKDKRGVARLEEHLTKTEDPLEMTAVLDALNLIAGDDLYRIITQLERMADVLGKHGTGRQTQLAQSAVTDALSRFIKEQEKKQGQGKGQGKPKKKRQTSSPGQGQGKKPGSASGMGQGGSQPRQNSDAGDVTATESEMKEFERMTGVVWGSLPPAVQEEITAARKQQLPERYQHLLRVYYKILAEGK